MTDQMTVTQEAQRLADLICGCATRQQNRKDVAEIEAALIAAEQRVIERLQFLNPDDAQIVLDELNYEDWEGLSIEDVKNFGAAFAYALQDSNREGTFATFDIEIDGLHRKVAVTPKKPAMLDQIERKQP